ncbi:hypothetical protein ACTFIU_009331 [Dictyostelium citrinum]
MSEIKNSTNRNEDDNKMMPPPPSNFLMPPPPSTLIKKSPNKPSAQPSQPPQQPKVELIYKEPEWSKCNSDVEYKFEVIKSGTIIEHINLNKKPFYLIGRLPICDIQLEHATISRQHAIIQHREGGKLYLYDLNSTHGSMINKQKCKPNIHIPIKVGDVIKFGESTRLFVLDGPNLDIDYSDDNNNSNNEKEKEKIKEKEKAKEKAAFLSLFTSNNSSNTDNKPIIKRDVWLKDDHDEEIRNHYKEQDDDNDDNSNNNNSNNKKRYQNNNNDNDDYDEDDLDNSKNKRKKKNINEDDDYDDDEDNEFYDRTNQTKDKIQKQQQLKLNDQSITELIEKRKQFEIEKISLQKQFKQSTLLNNNDNNKNKEKGSGDEDELDKFMNENEQELKKNTQQKIMNSLITIEDQIKKLESILFLKPEYKKYSQSLQASLKSIQLNDGIDKSVENKTALTTTTTTSTTTTTDINTTTSVPTTLASNSTVKSISAANKLMFNDENKTQNNNNNNNNNNKYNNKLNLLENEIPDEYKVKQIQKQPKKVYTAEENIKKLKEKQESEYVNLISRENNDDDDDSNRYGY